MQKESGEWEERLRQETKMNMKDTQQEHNVIGDRDMIGLQCYFVLQPTHFDPLLQLLLTSSSFFLHHPWAFLGFPILPFG